MRGRARRDAQLRARGLLHLPDEFFSRAAIGRHRYDNCFRCPVLHDGQGCVGLCRTCCSEQEHQYATAIDHREQLYHPLDGVSNLSRISAPTEAGVTTGVGGVADCGGSSAREFRMGVRPEW